mmetsp:Transcript_5024/g.14054  ORF Transcript_5024/g.14054 Transcript_5024/m.14054 type:complete len:110 (+) Transcript_5024:306-635(+)
MPGIRKVGVVSPPRFWWATDLAQPTGARPAESQRRFLHYPCFPFADPLIRLAFNLPPRSVTECTRGTAACRLLPDAAFFPPLPPLPEPPEAAAFTPCARLSPEARAASV